MLAFFAKPQRPVTNEEILLPDVEEDSSGELLEAYQKKIQHANALLDDIYERIRSL